MILHTPLRALVSRGNCMVYANGEWLPLPLWTTHFLPLMVRSSQLIASRPQWVGHYSQGIKLLQATFGKCQGRDWLGREVTCSAITHALIPFHMMYTCSEPTWKQGSTWVIHSLFYGLSYLGPVPTIIHVGWFLLMSPQGCSLKSALL